MARWLIVIEDGGQPLAGEILLVHADRLAKDLEEHADGVSVTIRDETGGIYAMREAKS